MFRVNTKYTSQFVLSKKEGGLHSFRSRFRSGMRGEGKERTPCMTKEGPVEIKSG